MTTTFWIGYAVGTLIGAYYLGKFLALGRSDQ